MLNNMDLYKLRMLSHLSQSQSVTVTAVFLNVSPSAVSQAIKNIETQLDKQLFIRVGKKLKPTPITKQICTATADYFEELSAIMESDVSMGKEIRIGAPPLLGTNELADKFCAYYKINPKIKLLISIRDTHQLIQGLLAGNFDFVFVDDTPTLKETPEIAILPYYTEELVLCGSEELRARYKITEHPSIKDLVQIPHVLYHKGKEGVFKWYQHHFGRQQDIKFSMTFDHPQGVLKAITQGLGLGVLPRSFLESVGTKKKLFIVPGKKSSLKSEVYLAQLKDKVPTQQEKLLIEFLRKEIH